MWEALELPIDLFQWCLKNSIIDMLMETEEGRKYLEDCKRYDMEDADIEHLGSKFIIEENGV